MGTTEELALGKHGQGGAGCPLLLGTPCPGRHPSLQGSTLTIANFYKQCDWLILCTFPGRTLLVTVPQPMLLAKGISG